MILILQLPQVSTIILSTLIFRVHSFLINDISDYPKLKDGFPKLMKHFNVSSASIPKESEQQPCNCEIQDFPFLPPTPDKVLNDPNEILRKAKKNSDEKIWYSTESDIMFIVRTYLENLVA